MLRLWPERRSLALFSDGAWLHAGGQWSHEPLVQAGAGVFNAAAALLQRTPSSAWPRAGLNVLLSDDLARSVPLPWQDGLRTSAQQARYAEACLEDAGVATGGWVLRHDYRRHGRAGIAFSVAGDTLQQLIALAMAQRLRLRSVLPMSAAAYWRQPFFGKQDTLTVLNEMQRVSLLQFSRYGLQAIEVQPVHGARDMAVRRLLQQARLRSASVTSIHSWSANEAQAIDSVIGRCYPDAIIRTWQLGDLV